MIPKETLKTIASILDRGNTAEIKKRRGEIIVMEVTREIKKAVPQTGGARGQTRP